MLFSGSQHLLRLRSANSQECLDHADQSIGGPGDSERSGDGRRLPGTTHVSDNRMSVTQPLCKICSHTVLHMRLTCDLQAEKEPNANEIAMLLANLAKSDDLLRILKTQRQIPQALSTSKFAIDQLMDCFVKGAEGSYNKEADFDYLSYFFADLSKVRLPANTLNGS